VACLAAGGGGGAAARDQRQQPVTRVGAVALLRAWRCAEIINTPVLSCACARVMSRKRTGVGNWRIGDVKAQLNRRLHLLDVLAARRRKRA